MIGGFLSVLCVSEFQGSLLGIVIMIDGSEKHSANSMLYPIQISRGYDSLCIVFAL